MMPMNPSMSPNMMNNGMMNSGNPSMANNQMMGQMPQQLGGIAAAPVHFTHGGFINSHIPGRTDRIPMSVESDSYIIPADIVSGLGQGNSLAGAHILKDILGIKETGKQSIHHAEGGIAGNKVPVVVAGGEFRVNPVDVARIGGGDVKKGHKVLDAFVKKMRGENIKTLRKLPGPKR